MPFDDGWDLQWFKERVKGREPTFRFIGGICAKMNCKTLLDVGGGIGSLNIFLPFHVKHHVVDVSQKAKTIGEITFKRVKFTTGIVDEISEKYDTVVALSVIEHLSDYEKFLRSVWAKTNKVACLSFRNGLDEKELIKMERGKTDYWDNKYSWPKMEKWIKAELKPETITIAKVNVNRAYSPELILIMTKGD